MTENLMAQWQVQRKAFNMKNAKAINAMHELKEQVQQAEPTEINLRLLVEIFCMLYMYDEAYKIFISVMDVNKKKEIQYDSLLDGQSTKCKAFITMYYSGGN